ncbi:MAG: hypothetical protein ACOYXB_08230 [Bacteroidota bacterium]
MNNIFITVLTSIIYMTCIQASAQRPPDSLFQQIVLFKRQAIGVDKDKSYQKFLKEYKLPQASGFYFRPDSLHLYIATAKHVMQRDDSIKKIMIQYFTILESGGFWTCHTFHVNNYGLNHRDSLCDIVLVYNFFSLFNTGISEKIKGFTTKDIVTKEVFYSMRPGQNMFYIGMYPDSLKSIKNFYWYPKAELVNIYKIPKQVKAGKFSTPINCDFRLKSIGKQGISGSPVFIEINGKYKLFGIINATNSNSMNQNNYTEFIGTGAFRLLEILEFNN